jgi:hypothetical protein
MLVDRGHDHGESLLQFDPGLGLKKKQFEQKLLSFSFNIVCKFNVSYCCSPS